MEYRDKVLKCAECGAEFVFTAGEQAFFADKGFKKKECFLISLMMSSCWTFRLKRRRALSSVSPS